MAKITYTADDGSVQEFDIVATAAPSITDVKVDESNGTSETLVPEVAGEQSAPTA